MVVNAANIQKDFEWIESRAEGDLELTNASDDYALLALQGPRSADILQPLTDIDLAEIKYYRFAYSEVLGEKAMVSRTGYTGEAGFEVMVAPELAEKTARGLLQKGAEHGLSPIGARGAGHASARGEDGALRERHR